MSVQIIYKGKSRIDVGCGIWYLFFEAPQKPPSLGSIEKCVLRETGVQPVELRASSAWPWVQLVLPKVSRKVRARLATGLSRECVNQ